MAQPDTNGLSSPFLAIPESSWTASNDLAFAFRDNYPVSPGHTLVVPRRLVATWFEATRHEQAAIMDLVDVVRRALDAELAPAGYNVGFNAGVAAGQTVMHLHVHVIPRFEGDMDDPTGGVRHVIPWKANYVRARPAPLSIGGVDPFQAHIKPLFAAATDIAIVAAFVQDSGLELIGADVFTALERGARVRLVTGDYLNITQADALDRMLAWQEMSSSAESGQAGGTFEARVIETLRLPSPFKAFHPKSWMFAGDGFGVAFVGSSNISRSALAGGIEWNLRADRATERVSYERVTSAFEDLWSGALPLNEEWAHAYANRARVAREPLPLGDAEDERPDPLPIPNVLQRDALDALTSTRAQGNSRALVVLATGVGKTLLAVLDAEAFAGEGGQFPRVLFLAHRAELLDQAAATFKRFFADRELSRTIGWFVGARDDIDADVVVASVQKLARREHLDRIVHERFDYVVVDEVHHATAASYRRILGRLDCGFVLGLTATPDRTDEADVVGLFEDNLAYRADMGAAIEHGLLVPFAYYGLKDDVDYANIPWRNQRFDPKALEEAVETMSRMEKLWEAWHAHSATRTLVFCCSVHHARFVRDRLRSRGLRAEAVDGTTDATLRRAAREALQAGELDALCAVDLFNEGVDLPALDRVVMLRPTESILLFIQQLGRGLRITEGKSQLSVIDFVGNHKTFLEKVKALVSLGGASLSPFGDLRRFLDNDEAPSLPKGCSVDIELEAKEILRLLLPRGRSEVERVFRELCQTRDERPTAAEIHNLGFNPATLRPAYGSWFEFVAAEDRLSPDERATLERARPWFVEVETTTISKSFKMVVLQALLEADALAEGMQLDDLASRCHGILLRSPGLFRDIVDVTELPDPRHPDPAAWQRYWKKNPIDHWCGPKKDARSWFTVDANRFAPSIPGSDDRDGKHAEALSAMTWELVEYRLAQYRARYDVEAEGGPFECKLTHSGGEPILKFPSRKKRPDLPEGETAVVLPDGATWLFRFMKEFVNVARPVGHQRNALSDLLRGWFGPSAGLPGTRFVVRFSPVKDGWAIEPVRAEAAPPPASDDVVAYPTLRVAAGAVGAGVEPPVDAERVRLPLRRAGSDVFAVRASGDSMDGGKNPIRDGDWVVMRYARGAALGAYENRVVLVQVPDAGETFGYQIKRVVKTGDGWELRSDNRARDSYDATADTIPIAVLIEVVRPESLAPPVGEKMSGDELARQFGIDAPLKSGRVGGHLFIVLDAPLATASNGPLKAQAADRRPGETAYAIDRLADGEHFVYRGLGRWDEETSGWVI